jgi:protein-L-isoaspartate(D-aspartate) O-methyltransferase
MAADEPTPQERLGRLIEALRAQGITDAAVLKAIEATPRDLFTPELFKARSWEDSALPIACGQTISQPFIVGLMTQALKVEPRSRVLEIGTGSGYQTTILSRLARLVYTVERYRTLMAEAQSRFTVLGLTNIITRFGDGGEGWPEQAPFDRIMVTAAPDEVPPALIEQLKVGGLMAIPVGTVIQELRIMRKTDKGMEVLQTLPVRYVPMTGTDR